MGCLHAAAGGLGYCYFGLRCGRFPFKPKSITFILATFTELENCYWSTSVIAMLFNCPATELRSHLHTLHLMWQLYQAIISGRLWHCPVEADGYRKIVNDLLGSTFKTYVVRLNRCRVGAFEVVISLTGMNMHFNACCEWNNLFLMTRTGTDEEPVAVTPP